MADKASQSGSRSHRTDHGIPWGIVTAVVVLLIAIAVIGKSVTDNARAPISSGVESNQK
jgi:hypothetical protein